MSSPIDAWLNTTIIGSTPNSIASPFKINSSTSIGSVYATPDLTVTGDISCSGELIVQGVKLSDRIDKIEEKLAILRPNEELEAKWENLRGLRNAYMELEAEIIEKEKVWSILKK